MSKRELKILPMILALVLLPMTDVFGVTDNQGMSLTSSVDVNDLSTFIDTNATIDYLINSKNPIYVTEVEFIVYSNSMTAYNVGKSTFSISHVLTIPFSEAGIYQEKNFTEFSFQIPNAMGQQWLLFPISMNLTSDMFPNETLPVKTRIHYVTGNGSMNTIESTINTINTDRIFYMNGGLSLSQQANDYGMSDIYNELKVIEAQNTQMILEQHQSNYINALEFCIKYENPNPATPDCITQILDGKWGT